MKKNFERAALAWLLALTLAGAQLPAALAAETDGIGAVLSAEAGQTQPEETQPERGALPEEAAPDAGDLTEEAAAESAPLSEDGDQTEEPDAGTEEPGEDENKRTVTFAGTGYTAVVETEAVDGSVKVDPGAALSFTLTAEEGREIRRVILSSAREKTVPAAVWDGSVATGFAGGSGTEADPYQIATGGQLAYLAQQVNGDNADYSGAYYVLTADIDLAGLAWTPIGLPDLVSPYDKHDFTGALDGQGHVIRNLSVTGTATGAGAFGLFGRISGARVENLGLADCRVSACYWAGGIAAAALDGSVLSGCWVTGEVSGRYYVGGVAGQMSASTAENCWNGARVSYTFSAGVAAGGVVGYAASASTVKNCWNVGEVAITNTSSSTGYVSNTAKSSKVGGIVGFQYQGGTVENCWNGGDVHYSGVAYTGVANATTIFGVGGIVGASNTGAGSLVNTIRACANTGSAATTQGYAGGIAGTLRAQNATNSVTLTECRSLGTVTADNASAYAGGLAGRLDGSTNAVTAAVENSYFAGSLGSGGRLGALVGNGGIDVGQLVNCYAPEGCADALAAAGDKLTVETSAFLSAEEMKTGAFVATLAGDSFRGAGDYPTLVWEADLPAVYGDVVQEDLTEEDGVYTLENVDRDMTVTVVTAAVYEETERDVTFEVTPAKWTAATLTIDLRDSGDRTVAPKSGTTYTLTLGETYTYTVTADGFEPAAGSVTVDSSVYTVRVRLEDAVPQYQVRFQVTPAGAAQLYGFDETEITGARTVTQGADLYFYAFPAEEYEGQSLTMTIDGANTAKDVWDGVSVDTSWYTPGVTQFTLTTGAQLAGLSELVAKGNTFAGVTLYLDADIDLSQSNFETIGYVTGTTGYGSSGYDTGIIGYPFSGDLRGGGHTVTLNITSGHTGGYAMAGNFVGLFGYLNGASVSGLRLAGAVTSGSYVGGLAGIAQESVIRDCISEVTVSGSYCVGGLVGLLRGASTVSGCYNSGRVTAADTAGGIAAQACRDYTDGATGSRVDNGPAALTACHNAGEVTITGTGLGNGGAGVLYAGGATLESCGNSGRITSTRSWNGGVAAKAAESMVNCYNTGDLYVSSTANAGGLYGMNSTAMVIENCYDIGTIYCGSRVLHQPLGYYQGTFDNCLNNYWIGGEEDTLTSNTTNGYGSHQFKKVTETELKALVGQLGDDAWRKDAAGRNDGYPVLRAAPDLSQFSAVTADEDTEGLYRLSAVSRNTLVIVTVGAAAPAAPSFRGGTVGADGTVTIRAGETDIAVVQPPAGGWTAGENTFTVTAPAACAVAVSTDGGVTYTRLAPVSSGGTSAQFTAELGENTIFAVVKKGDLNEDGVITAAEARRAQSASLDLISLDAMGMLAADLNGDGIINSAEVRQIQVAGLGLITLAW